MDDYFDLIVTLAEKKHVNQLSAKHLDNTVAIFASCVSMSNGVYDIGTDRTLTIRVLSGSTLDMVKRVVLDKGWTIVDQIPNP